MTHFELAGDIETFEQNEGAFKNRICSLFEPPCSPYNVRDLAKQPGSVLLNFTIRFEQSGPVIPHMRERLNNKEAVQEALGSDDLFVLVLPYEATIIDTTEQRSQAELEGQFRGMKAVISLNFMFLLLGAWGLVVFWTITARGQSCRKQAHSGWRSKIIPTSETLQVLVLSSFAQLIMCYWLHVAFMKYGLHTGAFDLVVVFGIIVGIFGTIFTAIFNSWIRGESASLRVALSVDKIDKSAVGWAEDDEDNVEKHREYRQVYAPGADRSLMQLATHDWEKYHMNMENAMGLFDMSENVFDEVKHEHDPKLMASFLNSMLTGVTGKKGGEEVQKATKASTDLQVVPVELPPGMPKDMIRDAMLQWRMRHAAHSRELDAVDWLLGQLDPGFELVAVKVPEQARLLLVEAMVQHAQNHAELQLDACHAVRVQSSLQQLSSRFQDAAVELPDDGKGTDKVRKLVVEALMARLEKSSKRDITQDEGMLLQYAISTLGEDTSLVAMPHKVAPAEERTQELKTEVDARAEEIRDFAADQYLYDEDIYTKVHLISRTKPPDHIEMIDHAHQGRNARRAKAKAALPKQHAAAPAAASAVASPAAAPPAAAPPAAAPAASPAAAPDVPTGEAPPGEAPPSPSLSPPMSPPPSPPGPAEQPETNASAQGDDVPPPPAIGKQLRLWWRFQRKRDEADHEKMPCWKQYTTLLIGTIAVFMCTVALQVVVNWAGPTNVFLDYFAVFSFGISFPFSLIGHVICRTLIRMLRRHLALSRGRSVEGVINRKAVKHLKKQRKASLAAEPPRDLETGYDGGMVEQGAPPEQSVLGFTAKSKGPWAFDTRHSANFNLEASVTSTAAESRVSGVATRFKEGSGKLSVGVSGSLSFLGESSIAEERASEVEAETTAQANTKAANRLSFRPGLQKAKTKGAAEMRANQILQSQGKKSAVGDQRV